MEMENLSFLLPPDRNQSKKSQSGKVVMYLLMEKSINVP